MGIHSHYPTADYALDAALEPSVTSWVNGVSIATGSVERVTNLARETFAGYEGPDAESYQPHGVDDERGIQMNNGRKVIETAQRDNGSTT